MRQRWIHTVIVLLTVFGLSFGTIVSTHPALAAASSQARRVNFVFNSNCSGFVFKSVAVTGTNQFGNSTTWYGDPNRSSFIPYSSSFGYYWWVGYISIRYTSYKALSGWPYSESYSKGWSGWVSPYVGDPVTISVACK